jgi:hypothetical protein
MGKFGERCGLALRSGAPLAAYQRCPPIWGHICSSAQDTRNLAL